MAYTTAQKVADLIGVSSTLIKADWITWSQGYVESRTGQKYSETTVTEELYDGTGNDELVLKNFPLTEVTKIEYFDEDESEEWEELEADYYKVYNDDGIIKFYDPDGDIEEIVCFEEGMLNWRVSYKYGHASTPAIIEFLTSLLTADLYFKSAGKPSVVSSESIGDYSIGYDSKTSIPIPELIEKIFAEVGISKTYIRGI
jgi:hypothetical protein